MECLFLVEAPSPAMTAPGPYTYKGSPTGYDEIPIGRNGRQPSG